MNILFISKNLIAGNLAYLLKKEGHTVKLFIEHKNSQESFENMVSKSLNWKADLEWVGKDGLVIFDDVDYGRSQDKLRKEGYTVFGGSELGDKLEMDREFGQEIFAKYGMKTVPLKDFDNIQDAIRYAEKHKRAWVIKQNDHGSKILNYIGIFEDGRDVISVLKNYAQNETVNKEHVSLHQKLKGVEIGVGRYFNGTDWVGPIEFNVEHTEFFPGNLGPTTSEMGTLAWYDTNEDNLLYTETLARLKPYLQEINFRGDMEINCIVNEDGAFPLEATARLGTPIVHLHSEIHSSPWGEFLHAVASGKQYDLKWKKGYGIVILVAVPPFPYTKRITENLVYNSNIYFDKMNERDLKHIHFEEVAIRKDDLNQFYIADSQGYVLYITGMGETIEEAQEKVYKIAKKVIVPKMFYRNDIGTSFNKEGLSKLQKLGYI